MTSTPPSDLINELGTLAAEVCEAEGWIAFPYSAEANAISPIGTNIPHGLSIDALRAWLHGLWPVGQEPEIYSGSAPPGLVPDSAGTGIVVAVPMKRANGELTGALCFFNPESQSLSARERRALNIVAIHASAHLHGEPEPARASYLVPWTRTRELNALLRGICHEDPAHQEEEIEACEHYARMERFEGALLGLVKAGHDNLDETLRVVTAVAAESLDVFRAEIWLFDQDRDALRLRRAHPFGENDHSRVLHSADCPHFFAALGARLVMAIVDAADDPRGRELLPHLAAEHRDELGAALIAPIWLQGRAAGVLAHFHGPGAREWSRDEQDFSGAVAGIIALALEADAHRQTEAQLHALAAHLDAVREEERAALARELHDELGQMLTALRMDAAWLGKACATSPEKLLARGPERVNAMKQLVDDAVATVQRISSDLRPGPLHELGLVAALEWQLNEFRKRSGILTSLAVPEGELQISERVSVALYRALQEALTNVARHAEATEVRATLRVSAQRISLEVRDNGKGIRPEAARDATSLGLIGMRERAGALGGEVIFRGAPGQGTAVLISLPNPATGDNGTTPS